ncbi:YdcF family protein [bacterium]|jgi:uncharacterized SAM-binding protein YcdF (DUF218 family)|nr:YdcF family protein [bacterium]
MNLVNFMAFCKIEKHRIHRIRRYFKVGAQALAWVAGAITLFCTIWAFIWAGDIYEYQDSVDGVHLPQVDVIVCLAGGRGRISAAGDLWYRYYEAFQNPPVFYVSGMGGKSNWNVLAKQVRPGVLSALKPKNVILENQSSNTDGNAQFLTRAAKEHGWTRILIVTSRYHMRRARYIFEETLTTLGHPVQIETLSVYQEPFEPNEWRDDLQGIRVTMIEYVKWLYYTLNWTPGRALD